MSSSCPRSGTQTRSGSRTEADRGKKKTHTQTKGQQRTQRERKQDMFNRPSCPFFAARMPEKHKERETFLSLFLLLHPLGLLFFFFLTPIHSESPLLLFLPPSFLPLLFCQSTASLLSSPPDLQPMCVDTPTSAAACTYVYMYWDAV